MITEITTTYWLDDSPLVTPHPNSKTAAYSLHGDGYSLMMDEEQFEALYKDMGRVLHGIVDDEPEPSPAADRDDYETHLIMDGEKV